MLPRARIARFSKIVRKDSAAVTDEQLIAAPGQGRRIVVDFLYVNLTSASGNNTVEIKGATGAMADDRDIVGGTFGTNGGFVQLSNIELDDNLPLVWSTTFGGASPVSYLTIVYHIEQVS